MKEIATVKYYYCVWCDKLATHTMKAVEVAGKEFDGNVTYFCTKHFNEWEKNL